MPKTLSVIYYAAIAIATVCAVSEVINQPPAHQCVIAKNPR